MDVLFDLISLLFLFFGIYFTVLFIFIFSKKEKMIFKTPKIEKYPSVSVVIPAFNEEKTLARTVEAIKKMVYPKKNEIIVINDGSTDRTLEVAKRIRGIKIFSQKNKGKASALNLALKKVSGEIFVCVDSDSRPDRMALMNAIPFFEEGVGSVTTTVLVNNARTWFEKMQQIEYVFVAWSRKIFEYLNSIYVTPGPMSLYRTGVLKKIGGFDEKNLTEDIEIAWNILNHKYKIKMALNSKVYTNVPSGIRGWWRQRLRWNVGGTQTFVKYFHLLFNGNLGGLGIFLLPMFSISYFLSFLGFMMLFYTGYNFLNYLLGSFSFGFKMLGKLYLVPNMFWFFGLVVILMTELFFRINIRTMNKVSDFPKRTINFLAYLFVYTVIFPFNLLHSFMRFLRKKYEW